MCMCACGYVGMWVCGYVGMLVCVHVSMRFGAVFDVQVPLLLLYRYRDAECMQKDVAWLCMVLGSYPVLPDVHMHMCLSLIHI